MSDSPVLDGKVLVVGVGAQKAGTSWLYSYLNKHPQASMSRVKELHYFDALYRPDISGMYEERFRETLSDFLRNADWGPDRHRQNMIRARAILDRMAMGAGEISYLDFFRSRVRPKDRVFGEITPSYAVLDSNGFQAIRDLHDDVRVIYVMRDPVKRLWSAFRHSGVTAEADVGEIRTQMARPHHALRSDYRHTIRTIDEVFGSSHALYLFYERLFTDDCVQTICRFLNIDYVPGDFSLRVNVGKRVPMPGIFRELARESLDDSYRFCRDRFGSDIPSSWSA